MKTDPHISLEMAQRFLEGALDPREFDRVKHHITDCASCRNMLNLVMQRQPIWNRWTATAHGTAYKNADPEKARTISEAVTQSLRSRLPSLNPLPELDRRRMKKAATFHDGQTRPLDELPGGGEADEWMLLAAAPRKRGNSSSAKGLAVEEKTGRVFPVTVSAWVGEEIQDKGHLSVVGAQVESRSRDGMEYKTTAPLTLLKEKLSKRFRTIPWLNHFLLHRREVYVELHNPQYLDKAESLLLAIIVAVSKAAAESKTAEDLVYSADVDMQGNLTNVGKIHEKAGYVALTGRYRLVVSKGNYKEVSAAVNQHKENEFLTFPTVGALFDFLKLIAKRDESTSKHKELQTQKRRRTRIWKRVGILAVIIALMSAGLLFLRAQRTEQPQEQPQQHTPFPPFTEQQFQKFRALSASQSRADLEAAVRMGLDVKPNAPMFKEVFIHVSRILMDRVNNRNDAVRALSHYVDYVSNIDGKANAEEAVADTIDPARDLMVRYGLSSQQYQKERFGEIITQMLTELGIEK